MRPTEETLSYGRRLAGALLGLDARYRAESGDEDGLVVLNLDPGRELAADAFASYREAGQAFDELRQAASRLPEPDRRHYYDDVCASSLAFIDWRERGLAFQDQLAAFLHVAPEPASDAELDALRSRASATLQRLGYAGDLARQCADWEARHRVPPADVSATLTDLLDAAWDRTQATVGIPAPKDDGMKVRTVSGVAYNARCDYPGRSIELNTDPVLTRPGLKHLAVHEGYPGHYLQFKRRELACSAGLAPADVLLSVVNTASSSVFEGIADNGMRVLGWLTDPDDVLQQILNRYRAGIGTGAAWRLHALGWPVAQVASWMREQALVGGEGWVANRMAFIAAPARAVLIWSYWWGEPVVARAWDALERDPGCDVVPWIYDRMHSNRTAGMHRLAPVQ